MWHTLSIEQIIINFVNNFRRFVVVVVPLPHIQSFVRICVPDFVRNTRRNQWPKISTNSASGRVCVCGYTIITMLRKRRIDEIETQKYRNRMFVYVATQTDWMRKMIGSQHGVGTNRHFANDKAKSFAHTHTHTQRLRRMRNSHSCRVFNSVVNYGVDDYDWIDIERLTCLRHNQIVRVVFGRSEGEWATFSQTNNIKDVLLEMALAFSVLLQIANYVI